MPRDKEFQRKKKDARMPVRDSHAKERMDTRQSEQDFNLLRARDAPSSSGTARSRRYETAAQQAADDTQPSKADIPQQADISIPEHLEGRDMDYEPARAPETQNPLEPGTSAPELRRRDFRYEDSRRADSDSGNSGTERHTQGEPGQAERRSRMHQHGNKYQQRFQEAAKPRNQRRNRRRRPKENQNGLPSWNLPLTSCRRRQKIKSWPRQGGQRKSWSRRKTVCLPAVSCGWKHLLILIRVRPKNA